MAIIKWGWDPFKEARPLLRFWERWPELEEWEAPSVSCDVYETGNEVVVKMPLVGVKPEDVDISISGNTLTVKGESKEEKKEEKKNYFHRELSYGAFNRCITVPSEVDSDKTEAEFEDGMLTLKLPKVAKEKSKKINIKARKK